MAARIPSLLWILTCTASTAGAQEGGPGPWVEAHCLRCHGPERARAGIRLDLLLGEEAFSREARVWDLARELVAAGEMPPAGEPPLPEADRRALLAALDHRLKALAADPRDPGPAPLRRLGRTEYRNTLRDLLGLPGDLAWRLAEALPRDAPSDGFDNQGAGLTLSPLLLERYQDVTEEILDAVLALPASRKAWTPPVSGAGRRAWAEERLSLAFRRPARPAEVEARLALLDRVEARGGDAAEGLRVFLRSLLLSPSFLFKVESALPERPGQRWRLLDGYALAARLSYFLWAAPPDEALRRDAATGALLDPETLAAQARRMLADPRARSLAEDFGGQWLGYRRILDQATDVRVYKDFYRKGLRRPMYEEARLLFQTLVEEDAPVFLLLDAPFTFVNGPLAEHYGLPGVEGPKMRRVELPDRRRGGVLGLGAILTATSYPTRTSPVLRGAWVLETLLGQPPPPPPPNAGILSSPEGGESSRSFRERLEAHRADPACASCHARIDPLGFALENFDGIGRWREGTEEEPIDSLGLLPDGSRVQGPVGLKDWLLEHREDFARTFLERLFTYGLGRPPAFEDRHRIQTMLERAGDRDYRFSAFVEALVRSVPFRYVRCRPPEEESRG